MYEVVGDFLNISSCDTVVHWKTLTREPSLRLQEDRYNGRHMDGDPFLRLLNYLTSFRHVRRENLLGTSSLSDCLSFESFFNVTGVPTVDVSCHCPGTSAY